MDSKLLHQPEHHFRFFDLCEEPKKIIQSIDDYEQIPLLTFDEAMAPLVESVSQMGEMMKLVKNKCRQQGSGNLSIDESASIMLYTMEWTPKEESIYYIVNRTLCSNDEDQLKPWYFYLKLLSTSLEKLPRSPHRIFYRAIQSDLNALYPSKKRFFWHGYSSWSNSIELFNQDKFRFDQTKNNRTLFILHSECGIDISEHSFYSIKGEILLPPGKRFRVVSCRVSTKNGFCVIILSDALNRVEPTTIDQGQLKLFALSFKKQMKKLEKYPEINLDKQNLTDSHMDTIVKYAVQKKCQWLSLKNNEITSHGLCILAKGLEDNQSLQSLYLTQNFIDDMGVEYLTKVPGNTFPNLTLLALSYNQIGDRGAQCLADILLTNKTLTDLWLSYNSIGNTGAKALAAALSSKNETLMQLYLHGNKFINDLVVTDLILMLKSNQRLNTLWLHDCKITNEGKEQLENTVQSRNDFDLSV